MRESGTWRGLLTYIIRAVSKKNEFKIFYPQRKTLYFPGFKRIEFKVKSYYFITYPERRIIIWSIWCLWISFTWFTISVKNYSAFIESLGLWSVRYNPAVPAQTLMNTFIFYCISAFVDPNDLNCSCEFLYVLNDKKWICLKINSNFF